MTKWWHISLLLCCYGFFKEYRPSEPFISAFLTGPWKNFTDEQVSQDIYPVGMYCNLALLVVVFLLTDFLRYKPVLIAGGFAGIITWTSLIFGKTIPLLQVTEFFYGLFMASEVAYYTYIYAKVDKDHYQKVTSHTRTAFLLGKASAGLSSQLFVHFHVFDYLELNYLTASALVLTTLVSVLLPSVPRSVYFHRYVEATENYGGLSYVGNIDTSTAHKTVEYSENKWKNAFHYLYYDLKQAYTNLYVVEWCVWWALSTCMYLQVITYAQLLWEEINREGDLDLFNGLVEFIYSLVGAAATFGVGYLKLPWHKWGEITLGVLTVIQGAFVLSASYLSNLYIAYVMHICYGVLYHVAITIASSEVAKDIKEDSYALIFGINTFFALLLETVLTAVVIVLYQCDIRTQFQIYGYCLFVIGGIFLLIAPFVFCKWSRERAQRLAQEQEK